jgi:hypothetical protein
VPHMVGPQRMGGGPEEGPASGTLTLSVSLSPSVVVAYPRKLRISCPPDLRTATRAFVCVCMCLSVCLAVLSYQGFPLAEMYVFLFC